MKPTKHIGSIETRCLTDTDDLAFRRRATATKPPRPLAGSHGKFLLLKGTPWSDRGLYPLKAYEYRAISEPGDTPAKRVRACGATTTSSAVAGDVSFQETAKLIYTADIGRIAA